MPLRDGIIIREAAPNVWTFCRPFNVFGIFPVGGRSTAIKLESGGVWVFASTPLTTETKKKLAELGEVKYIIAGNAFHHMFLGEYKRAYPEARVIGPEDLNKKKEAEGWQLDAVYSAAAPDVMHGFESEIHHCYFSGHQNKDIAFYHVASKTVIAADLLMNLPGKEQYSSFPIWAYCPVVVGLSPYSWVMRLFIRLKTVDKDAMRRDAKEVAKWDFERFIPCHGNIIETDAKKAWCAAWRAYL